MGLRERVDALQPRERRLLNMLTGLFVVVMVLLFPIGVSAMLAGVRRDNNELREAVDRMLAERDDIQQRLEANKAVLARYATPAPALAAFLDNQAKPLELDIPEFKDRAAVPQGKAYEERATEIRISKVKMRPLMLFMEKIAQSRYPISVNKLNIRKRGAEADLWDASMTVSAYHRVAKAPSKTDAKENGEK